MLKFFSQKTLEVITVVTHQDLKESFQIIKDKEKTDKEKAEAYFKLGGCFLNGAGVKQNIKIAFDYLKKAADVGHVEAQFNLAAMVHNLKIELKLKPKEADSLY